MMFKLDQPTVSLSHFAAHLAKKCALQFQYFNQSQMRITDCITFHDMTLGLG